MIKRASTGLALLCAWLALQPAATLGQSAPPAPGGFHIVGTTVNSGSVSSPPPSGSTDVTVVTWNIRVNDSSAAHARAAVAYLVNTTPRPQVIALQEARQSQYSSYISELQARTGVAWSGVLRTHCPPSAWNGSTCTKSEDEGVAVFSSLPILNSGGLYFPYADAYHSARAAARASVNVNGAAVQVFSVHLIPGNATARYSSMAMLKTSAASYASPRLIAGDFNADPDQITSAQGMGTVFVDAWQLAGSGSRFTYAAPSPTMKLDYWFSDAAGKAQPQRAVVLTSAGSISDHFPVGVTYRVSR
jgi:endonuclease/exonuclease/phosphatase family metal-dependent hydrolase